MGGNLRYLLAAAILALLGFLALIRPSQPALVQVETRNLIGKLQSELLDSLAKAGVEKAKAAHQTVPEDKTAQALVALGGKPLAVVLDMRLPDSARSSRLGVDRIKAMLDRSPLLALGDAGPPIAWQLAGDRVSLSLTVPGIRDPRPGKSGPLTITKDAELPSFVGLIPPFLIILLAILFARTIPALFAGVLLGTILAQGWAGPWYFVSNYLGERLGFTNLLTFRLAEQANTDNGLFNILVLGFVVMLAAAIGIMTRNGGIEGMVDLVKGVAKTARSSQIAAWLMGLLIFFDDYANSIVVGSTMRPLTDRLKVSREKLAYIVDATAAPVAGLALLSTWVVTEISYFEPTLDLVRNADGSLAYPGNQGFAIFIDTMPFRFYCFLTIFMVAATIMLKREFGPMLTAERRARHEGKPIADGAKPMIDDSSLESRVKDGAPRRWWNGLVPILVLIIVTVIEIWRTGSSSLEAGDRGWLTYLREVVGNADSSWAIFIGAAAAAVTAGVLGVAQGILSPLETLATAGRSAKALAFAVAILVLAWCIGFVCEDLGTRHYLIAMTEKDLKPELLPTVLFLVSCLVSFSTGSSWSTMAILLPNVVLLAHGLGEHTPLGGHALMLLSIGAVLEGSIFGDHCSPISDTTVLSSTASASDHLDHVRTQAPYALLVMLVSLVCGYLPVAFIAPGLWPVCYVLATAAIVGVLFAFGRDPEAAT